MRMIAAALALLTLPGCVYAVGESGPDSAKRLESNGEAAVRSCGAGRVAIVTAKGFACQGAPDRAIDALTDRDD